MFRFLHNNLCYKLCLFCFVSYMIHTFIEKNKLSHFFFHFILNFYVFLYLFMQGIWTNFLLFSEIPEIFIKYFDPSIIEELKHFKITISVCVLKDVTFFHFFSLFYDPRNPDCIRDSHTKKITATSIGCKICCWCRLSLKCFYTLMS